MVFMEGKHTATELATNPGRADSFMMPLQSSLHHIHTTLARHSTMFLILMLLQFVLVDEYIAFGKRASHMNHLAVGVVSSQLRIGKLMMAHVAALHALINFVQENTALLSKSQWDIHVLVEVVNFSQL